jgi:hypothetical protein
VTDRDQRDPNRCDPSPRPQLEGTPQRLAVTFLALCVWMGPDRACFFVAVAAIIAAWVALCRRFPFVGVLTLLFFDGLVSGLFRRRW